MAKSKSKSSEYIRHQHKIMFLIGVVIVAFSYESSNDIILILGSAIIGIAIANIKIIDRS